MSLYNDELTEADEQLLADRLLRFARAMFQQGLFAQASQAYDELPADRLTRADAMRADLARRRS